MIFFLAQKWTLPKQKGSLRELSFIFLWMSTLCSFLCIFALIAIQFLEFTILSSFVQKDFHLSFPSTQKNIVLWKEYKTSFSERLKSPILQELSYARQSGLLFGESKKIPIELQAIEPSYTKFFPFTFKSGSWDFKIPSIILSEEIAFTLQSHVGDVLDFTFLKQKSESSPVMMKLLVTGILKTMPGDDPYLAFGPLSYFGNFLRTELKQGILLSHIKDASDWAYLSKKETKIPMNDIFSRHYNLLFSFAWEKILLYFILLTILFISCIIIYISFSIIFKAYRSQWALLKILGIERSTLIGVFFLKTFLLVLGGFILGLSLVLTLFSLYLTAFHLPLSFFFVHIINFKAFSFVFLIQLLLCGISFILPIYRYYNRSLVGELHHD